ncbi:MAG: hypothetical protein EZS28_041135 [Streblomastix strix]|uniref:Uncharacterized protein n=1 Tax=Streblomastix strix TaxID=222440 RepID=A0A5J4TYX3_9EUKA|nr:MAG: hypothetical protein EZS28_041135 [Streblomastix strix]
MSAIVGNIGVVIEFKVCDIRFKWSGGRCHKPIIQGAADLINVVHFGRKGIPTGLPDSDSEFEVEEELSSIQAYFTGLRPIYPRLGGYSPPSPLPRGPSPPLTPYVHASNPGQVGSDSQCTGLSASELREAGLGQIIKLIGKASPLLKSISDSICSFLEKSHIKSSTIQALFCYVSFSIAPTRFVFIFINI